MEAKRMSELFQRYAVGDTIGRDLIVTAILSEVPDRHPIYLVWDKRSWCAVACKVYRNSRKAQQEHEILSSLSHPNIIRSLGTYEPAIMLTEYLYGPTLEGLAAKCAGNRLGIRDAIRAVIHVGGALAHLHQRGWVHLDIKPSNILLVHGRPILFDFGAARVVGGPRPPVVQGTDPYMAPEECTLGAVSPASDVFSLGVTLFELLTGEHPFRDTQDDFYPQTVEEPLAIRTLRPRVPRELAALIQSCLSSAPEKRPELKQLLPKLNGFLTGKGRMWPSIVRPEGDLIRTVDGIALAA
jgi:serine/threonine protein kinase